MINLVDTHCHLYSEEFDGNVNEILERAEKEGVHKIFLPSIDHLSIEAMLQLEVDHPGRCFAMMGLHPCYVKENYLDELAIVKDWLSKRKFAAVGEIGLDFYWDKTFTDQQYQAFDQQIEMALMYDLPIVIHTRNAMDETINVVKKYVPRGISGIFHCFSGNYDQAKEIIEAGFYLGIGGVITYKNSGLAEVIKQIPLEHLVLETDAPYLSPVPYRGKRNESSYLKLIAQKIAEIKNTALEDIASVTTANAQKIFQV